MKTWQRRTIGALMLGGSSIGLAAIASEIPITQLGGVFLMIVVAFVVLFVYGIAVGVLMIENAVGARALALPFWLAQIPVIQSAWISYGLYTGAKVDVLLKSDFDIGFVWSGGAQFSFYLLPGDSGAVGVNLVAAVVSYLLWKNRSAAASPSAEPRL